MVVIEYCIVCGLDTHSLRRFCNKCDEEWQASPEFYRYNWGSAQTQRNIALDDFVRRRKAERLNGRTS
jgi:hypothetical protein